MIDIEYLKKHARVKCFEKGSVTIQESDAGTACMYILLQGNATVKAVYEKNNKGEIVSEFI